MAEAGLSRATFAKLSPHPYLLANLEPSNQDIPPARSNGRAPDQGRTPEVNVSSLSHAHGSSLIRMGDTTVICGVRGETILTVNVPNYRASNRSELRDYDLVVPNIELATGSSPQNLPGGPPSSQAQILSTRIYSLLHSSKLLDPADFRILHRQTADQEDDEMQSVDEWEADQRSQDKYQVIAYWVLYIDIFFISLDGNQFDAAWTATMAALRDTKLPQARYDADREVVVCSCRNPKPLSVNGFPLACTAAVFTGKETDCPTEGRYWVLVDPDTLEESLCDETLTVVLDCSGKTTSILSISKHGGTVITSNHLRSKELLSIFEKRCELLAKALSI